LKTFAPEYLFYYKDNRGPYKSIFGDSLAKFSTRSSKAFQKEKAMHSGKKLFESDLNLVYRCLETNYSTDDTPKLHTAFFDIETDFHYERGFATVDDPFNAITAISVYLDWAEQLITLVLPPKSLSWESAEEISNKFENCILFNDEKEMLDTFLTIIDDADILSGWNSEGFDIPYTVQRISKIMGRDHTKRFCLWDEYPKKRMFERFGAEHTTFDTIGRVHLDYMQLYRKYTYHEMHSYSLNAISEYELKEHKVEYEGTLDQLYNKDFETFIDYNRQDVMLIHRMDKKLKFIDLANVVAHANSVLLPTTMGAVATTEQAIINECHRLDLRVPDKIRSEGGTQAAGAYVAYPRKGIHEWIGAIDINSLYPSAIRALNMGPETIIGQLRPTYTDEYIRNKMEVEKESFAAAWEGLFGSLEYTAVMACEPGRMITVDWEDGNSDILEAKDVWNLIFNSDQNWILSANGTIFKTDRKGIIPGLLEGWYADRKRMQAELKKAKDAEDEVQIEYWDKRQLVKKILLNSLYGALLNPHCRFFDMRIGQSTTLTGRAIVQHMSAFANEIVEGDYNYLGKSVIYNDTDSLYFSVWPMIKDAVDSGNLSWSKESCIELYESIATQVNESFPSFMERAFHCPRENGALIKGGLELIATTGLYITKKRYAVLKFYDDGDRVDIDGKTGKVKAMGLDLKRSDTPAYMQEFLSELLKMVLDGGGKEDVVKRVIEFKTEFAEKEPWEMGRPMRANNLTSYTEKHRKINTEGVDALKEKAGKNSATGKENFNSMIPAHVLGAINWNKLRDMNSDNYSMKLTDGQKVIVCKLKDNPLKINCVSYPVDESRLPQWFKDLPFEKDIMEEKMIDTKLNNLFGVLNWKLEEATDIRSTFNNLFSFE
jgi:DNA polymerase elongation subunit (family B)